MYSVCWYRYVSVPSQESEQSCQCVLPSQESEQSCTVCVSGIDIVSVY